MSNLTSIGIRHQNSQATPTTQQAQVQQDDEDSNPLLEVEVRDIVNNYLDDSLQDEDDVKSASEQEADMAEV